MSFSFVLVFITAVHGVTQPTGQNNSSGIGDPPVPSTTNDTVPTPIPALVPINQSNPHPIPVPTPVPVPITPTFCRLSYGGHFLKLSASASINRDAFQWLWLDFMDIRGSAPHTWQTFYDFALRWLAINQNHGIHGDKSEMGDGDNNDNQAHFGRASLLVPRTNNGSPPPTPLNPAMPYQSLQGYQGQHNPVPTVPRPSPRPIPTPVPVPIPARTSATSQNPGYQVIRNPSQTHHQTRRTMNVTYYGAPVSSQSSNVSSCNKRLKTTQNGFISIDEVCCSVLCCVPCLHFRVIVRNFAVVPTLRKLVSQTSRLANLRAY